MSDAALQSPNQYCSFSKHRKEEEHWLWTEGILGKIGRYGAKRPDKDGCRYLRPLYANMERSAKASQCHSGLCWFAEPEQSAKRSRRHGSLNVIHNPFWPREMKCVCLSVCYVMCLAGFESSSQRWARHRFNYAVIECDSLITKGRMWGLISTPRAAGSAQDDRTNRFLE